MIDKDVQSVTLQSNTGLTQGSNRNFPIKTKFQNSGANNPGEESIKTVSVYGSHHGPHSQCRFKTQQSFVAPGDKVVNPDEKVVVT